MNIHGPSLLIGIGITIVSIIASFAAFSMMDNEQELVLEEVIPKKTTSESVTLSVFTDNASPHLGDKNAPVTLVEFGDYQCFFCNKFFHTTENNILEDYIDTGKVKIIFKDFTIIGEDSVSAAHAAHCADEQGLFWEYHDVLYNNWTGENNGWASSENLHEFAKTINLDIDEFSECMLSAKYQQKIVSSNDDARTLGITGTPAFFVIGPDNQVTRISGAQPYEVFAKIFDSELEK